MKHSRRFWRNVLFNVGATGTGSVLQAVLLVVLARFLDVQGFAGYLTAAALVGVGEMASDFGARIWAIKSFALPTNSRGVLRQVLTCKAFFSGVSVIILALLPIQGLSFWEKLLCFCVAVSQPATDPLLWNLRGKERMDIEAGVMLAWRMTTVLALAALAICGYRLTTLLIAWLAANGLRICCELRLPPTLALLSNQSRCGRASQPGGARLIALVFPMGVAMLLMSLFYRLGVIGLSFIARPEDVAAYGSAYTLAASMGFIATGITAATFPQLARSIEARQDDVSASILSAKLILITWVFAPLCTLGILCAPPVFRVLFGAKLSSSGWVMVLLMPGLYISCINAALKFALNAMGLNWADAVSVVIGILTFSVLLMAAFMVPPPPTAALAWSVGELVIFISKVTVLKHSGRPTGVPVALVLTIACALWVAALARYSHPGAFAELSGLFFVGST